MKTQRLVLAFFTATIIISCNSSESKEETTALDDSTSIDKNANTGNERSSLDVSDWPERPRLAVLEMRDKYGDPVEVSSEAIVWHNEGPYKRIMVTKKEIPHDFPIPHMDFLEHTISYNVPTDKVDDLVAFDASMTINKTAGEMSARCDLEGHNILTHNLAHDIVTGKKTVAQARVAFGEIVKADFGGKHPAYVEKLQFTPPTEGVLFPDKPIIAGSPRREMPDTEGTDAEVLSFVIAVDVNEILAAAEAQKKELSKPVMDYAKMLHTAHGENMAKTIKVGQTIKVTPSDTKAVDEVKKKGAGELATLIPLKGKEFESAYIDAMIKGHTEVLSMIDTKLSTTAKSDALKTHLTSTREHVAMHLEQAKKLKGN